MQLTVEKLVYGGDGLARLPADEQGRGKAVFVPFVLEGENVDADLVQQKPGFARANLRQVLKPSAHRVTPECPYFMRCGGCHYQHASYEHQLEIKASILIESLRRVAKLELGAALQIHASPPWNYRNRTRLRTQISPEFALGYNRFGSHALEPVERCPISSPLINQAIGTIWDLGRKGQIDSHVREIEFFSNAQDTELLAEVYLDVVSQVARDERLNLRAWSEEFRGAIPGCVGVSLFRAQRPSESKTESQPLAVAGSASIQHETKTAKYRVSAGSFFQTNRHLTETLVELVTQGVSGTTALDLYAGVGLFSTVLSREFTNVIAVESSPNSCSDLAYNAPGNVKSVRSTVEQYLQKHGSKLRPDLVVVDPPRAGLRERVAGMVVQLLAPRVTYVSCDPATLARDLVPFVAAGYRVEQAHLVDLFPQTFHLESVLQLVR
ncbi:MAG TPA: 23S rRNA (uracil(1939)-C(5))-methyltransferase RlmD [Terriglobales bacterium]|nr:23S rRNA (uracil(1939)-C(5))-methyltransferase RlmD [Terriglobales bacterium]